jgi:MFS family permease
MIGREIRTLWAAQSVSTFGDALTKLTLILLITERTRSVAAVGTLAVVMAVPGVLGGMVAGAYVDRWDRRRTMIAADTGRAVLMALTALVVARDAPLATIYLLTFVQAGVGTFFDPARAALMQIVVPAGADGGAADTVRRGHPAPVARLGRSDPGRRHRR